MDELLTRAQDCLRIESVNLKESFISLADDTEVADLDSEETISQSFRSVTKVKEVELSEKVEGANRDFWEYSFLYSVGVRLIYTDQADESFDEGFEPLLQVMADFSARYISQEKLDKEALTAFSEENVGYHVWPYWREFVQSSCSRIGLWPAIEIPLYRVTKRPKK